MNLNQWAIKWGIPFEAVEDLRVQMGAVDTSPQGGAAGDSESAVQNKIRLEASEKGARLWRNNVGAVMTETGQMVRYGLANDSKKMNAVIKSHDLIGLRPVTITHAHVGQVIGQFVSREVKGAAWRYSGTERERAQLKWAELIISLGGDACFANKVGTL